MAWDFAKVRNNVRNAKDKLPVQLAQLTQRFFVKSWQDQGWNGQRWQEVKRRIEGKPEYKYPMKKGLGRRTRAILVESGKLRRETNNSIRVATFQRIRLVVGDREAKYAGAHNQGDEKRGLPKRQFMGQATDLTRQQRAKIDQFFTKVW
jgi:phage gpG-like protein